MCQGKHGGGAMERRLDSICRLWHKAVMGDVKNGRKQFLSAVISWMAGFVMAAWAVMVAFHPGPVRADDLDQIRQRGVLRHLGVPYARFVTGSGDGLDVELIQMFAASLGVKYKYVHTTWKTAFGDLTGKDPQSGEKMAVKGDILANGVTILPWREKLVSFSPPTFASQVWLIARADHPLAPITPGAGISEDIEQVRFLIKGHTVTGMAYTCLDPVLYGIEEAGAQIRYFEGKLIDLAPYVIDAHAGLALLDVPDALVAMEKWPGQLKVIGPVSYTQKMGAAMGREAVVLRQAFARFLEGLKRQGRYRAMIEKYYPGYVQYFPGFFSDPAHGASPPARGKEPR